MKKIISLLLSLVMVISIYAGFGVSAFAENDISYNFDSATGTLTISGTGSLPSYNNSQESPYYNDTEIKKLVIEDGITYVGSAMFFGCSAIEELIMPYDINYAVITSSTGIGYNNDYIYHSTSFYGCTNIKKITLTKGSGSSRQFSNDIYSGVQSDFLRSRSSNSVIFTPWYISRGKLAEIVFEEGITSIALNTFYGSYNVKTITIPSTVEEILDDFSRCNSLQEINVSKKNPIFDSSTRALINKATKTLLKLPFKTDLSEYTVPETVENIADFAFNNCSKLLKISIHDKVNDIGYYAFNDTAYFNLINNWTNGVLYIGNHLISVKSGTTDIRIKKTCKTLSKGAFDNCTNPNTINFTNPNTLINCYLPATATIGGYIPSTAYDYAIANNRTFDDLSFCEHTNTYTNTIKPTCTTTGKQQVICLKCEKIVAQSSIAATGHSLVIDRAEIAPTFKKAGKTTGSHCSVCGAVIQKQTVVPKLASPKLSKVTKDKKAFTARWAKVNVDGYEIRYSVKKNMKQSKTVKALKSATSKKVNKLKANKTYYVQIRGYKMINDKNVYSKWSAKKKVIIK